MKINKIINSVICSILIVLLFCIFLVIFVDLPFIPTWKELTGEQAAEDKISDEIIFLSVGEGDAILIKSNGRYALIDTGDGVSTDIVRELKQYGVAGLDALILTHWHSDHIGAATQILDEFYVLNLVVPKLPTNSSELYTDAVNITNKSNDLNISYSLAKQGLVINVGDFRLSVLYSNPAETDENNRAVILMAKCHKYKFLLMSDVDTLLEEKLIENGYKLDCDVLKVGHHGSKNSTGSKLLSNATPEYAVISVGSNNSYNHPSGTVLDALYYAGATVLRTDRQGCIEFKVTNEEMLVNASLN